MLNNFIKLCILVIIGNTALLADSSYTLKKNFSEENVSLTFCKKPSTYQQDHMLMFQSVSIMNRYAQLFSTPIDIDLEPKEEQEIIEKMFVDIDNQGGVVESYEPCKFQNFPALLTKGSTTHFLAGKLYVRGLLVITNQRYYVFTVFTKSKSDLNFRFDEFINTVSINNS